MNFNWIKDLAPSGVFLLLNKTSDSFYINYSIDSKYFISRVVEIIKGSPANSDFEFLELSKSSDIETLKIHTEYWIDYYLSLGYCEMFPRARKSLKYKVRVLVAPDFKAFDVQLVGARGGSGTVVGRFNSKKEAQDFVDKYYSSDIIFPVYSTNSLTKELLSNTREIGIILR